jgi:protease-4
MLDLSNEFKELAQEDAIGEIVNRGEGAIPGLYDAIRLIRHAETDNNISGIYIKAEGNSNGFAASDELRNALQHFKTSKKFIIAHGDGITQRAYFVASVADRIYANPVSTLEWDGFSTQLFFIKGALDKLGIQPQIFYAGKFKSATEPFRVDRMTPENKLQTTEWLSDLYNYFLVRCAEARKLDTATLHQLANTAAIQTTQDAVTNKLLDGAKYDDEVKDELKKRLRLGKYDKLNFISINAYEDAVDYTASGTDRIAVIYAQGDIVDGNGTAENIGGDAFMKLIPKYA